MHKASLIRAAAILFDVAFSLAALAGLVSILAPEIVPDVTKFALAYAPLKLQGFTNNGAGNTAVANIQVGAAFKALLVRCATTANPVPTQAQISAAFTAWVLKVNGAEKWNLTGAELATYNAYHGFADQDGYRTIWFADPSQATIFSEDFLLYGTVGLRTFTLEVTADAAAAGASLELYAMIDPRGLSLGAHRVTQKYTEAIGGAGVYNVLLYPAQADRMFLEKIHFRMSANNITNARLLLPTGAGDQELYNLATNGAKTLNGAQFRPFTWQSTYFHLDMTMTRRISDLVHLGNKLRVELTVDGAASLTHIWQIVNATLIPADQLRKIGFAI